MEVNDIKYLQQAMNSFADRHPSLGHARVQVDGQLGRLTKKLIRDIKYDLGYLAEKLDYTVDENFFKRMNHPTDVNAAWGVTKEAIVRGKKRRAKRRRDVLRNKLTGYLKPGVGSFDGVVVAKTAIPVLNWCRNNGWKGRLVSGYRTPAYSESLCFRMCGRPSCPGKCAGRSTNHAYATPERFAMDVSDYVNFGHIVAKCPIRPHVHNALPNDLVHFSPQGN